MLKTPDEPPAGQGRSIGDMIEQVFDDALDYGRAELELIKARVLDAAESYVRAAILVAVAGVFGVVALVTLFIGIALALARWIGPLGGAIVSTLLAAAIAGVLVWLARRDLEQAK